ncbi:hypothetical protein VIB_001981 [Vibrio metschnikovii CIP 69.14]|nr:hypothetical protein VIB_001981 [Vibrio metschnikovii CIP 69.14]
MFFLKRNNTRHVIRYYQYKKAQQMLSFSNHNPAEAEG